jgi:hypothetical protein
VTYRTWPETCEDICDTCGRWAALPGACSGSPGSYDPGDDVAFEPAPGARCARCEEAIECARIHETPLGWELHDHDGDVVPYVFSTREEAERFAARELGL